jgi:PPK2 family polyphosphate:nucleotide phosphotransferase
MGKLGRVSERYCVDDGARFRIAEHDPADLPEATTKEHAQERLTELSRRLSQLQDKLYAQDRWSLLVVMQALDAAGKDGAIEHVMRGVNPQGCEVHAFKVPSPEELDHDFLWRCAKRAPGRGRIGVFNRSHYEEVLVVRVHPELLERQRIPAELVTEDLWAERIEDIAAFERHLARSGTRILKFFLNVSKEEQKERFLARLDEPEKNWKFSPVDVAERAHWDEYMLAYEDAIRGTAFPHAPWYVVPADRKWFARWVISDAIVAALEALRLEYPSIPPAERDALEKARRALESES